MTALHHRHDPLDTVLARARELHDHDQCGDVVRLLAGPLAALDPATLGPDHQVVDAAMLYTRAADPDADCDRDDMAWARYAHRAARTLHGPHHPHTIEAIDTLATVLHRRHLDAETFQLRRQLIQTHLDRGDLAEHLRTRMALTADLHTVGRCGDTVRDATTVWQHWTDRYGVDDPDGLPPVLHLIAMLAGCRRLDEARQHIDQARHLYPVSADARSCVFGLLAVLAMPANAHRSVCAWHLDHDHTTGGEPSRVADQAAVWKDLLP